jgi:hypothetical protein
MGNGNEKTTNLYYKTYRIEGNYLRETDEGILV